MPILAIGITKPGREEGFTLIELLIVLTIVAISLGLILPNFGDDESHRLARIAEDTLLQLESAADFSNNSGRMIGWHVRPDATQFEALDSNGQWVNLRESGFEERHLPSPLQWDIKQGSAAKEGRYVFVPGEPAPAIQVMLVGEKAHLTIQLDALAHGKIVRD